MEFPIIDKEKTGKRLRLLMDFCQISPAEIQKYLNLSCVQTVYRWLGGKNIPSVDHLYALSALFGVQIDELIVGSRGKFGLRVRGTSIGSSGTDVRGSNKEGNRLVARLLQYYEKLSDLAA